MFKYIAGNTIKHSLKKSNIILKSNKIPIINYAVENVKSTKIFIMNIVK